MEQEHQLRLAMVETEHPPLSEDLLLLMQEVVAEVLLVTQELEAQEEAAMELPVH